MKAYLEELIRLSPSPLQSRNIIREYLQARILGILQRRGALIPLAFHGGTALRFLYGLPRHSEDLDFALERSRSQYDLEAYNNTIKSEFTKEGYELDFKISDKRVVHSTFIHFRGLLYEMGLSPHPDETLSIRIEVDTHPPRGANLSITTVRKHLLLRFQHHDRPSLLAGKIHAILQRSYTKGRDLYDLLWYLSDTKWPGPNVNLLNNALKQTGWSGLRVTTKNWKSILSQRLDELDWKNVRSDVLPFIENPDEINLLDKETLHELLG